MAKPLYVLAFEHFKQKHADDPLKAIVSFGLYIDSEYKWASAQQAWPTDGKYKHYHECSVPHSTDLYDESADKVLFEFVTRVVEEEKHDFLDAALAQYREEAAKSHHKWWHGVLEALGGAVLWSVILIVAAIVAGRLGIDVIGAFERAAGGSPQQQNFIPEPGSHAPAK
ncbi:MAG TPA: hypothetical protein VII40_21075 [Xanthobacteraceae bacterium]|jgi:hypothetical protein